jgi:hypothetical protein
MGINHQLLCSLGVGHPRLEAVRAACEKQGFACKLTGAGGGGCAIALVSRCCCAKCEGGAAVEAQALVRLRESLRYIYLHRYEWTPMRLLRSDLEVDVFESSLGREGVKWRCWPPLKS